MNVYTASEAKTHFGAVIDAAQFEPVRVDKNGRPYVYIMSTRAYENLRAIEDAYKKRK